MKLSDKDIKFVMWAAIASLLLMSFMHLFAPRAPSGEVYDTKDVSVSTEEEKATLTRLEMLSPDALEKLLASKNNAPTFVLIYTSWCPHCRQALPDMLNLRDKGMFKNARTLFISVDQDPEKLARYLSQPAYRDAFTPYIINPREVPDARKIFASYHFNYKGSIPYAVLMDANNQILAQTDENGGWDDLLDAIKELR